MKDFPANSQKAKVRPEEPKEIRRVTTAETARRKRGLGRQVKETFVGGSARMAAEYMVTEVVVPAIQETLIEAFQGGIERLIKGDSSRARRVAPSSGYSPHINYQGMSRTPPKSTQSPRMLSRQSRTRQDFADLVIQNRQEATEVIDQMFEILDRFGVVSVHDLYELTGVASSHVDHKWGWTQLRGAKAVKLRTGGYLLDLPEPEALD